MQRGSLTFWIEERAIQAWLSLEQLKKRGRRKVYSDDAILMLLVLREIYHLPLRAAQGLAQTIFFLMGLSIPVPCYTQVCRRSKTLGKVLKHLKKKVDVVFDSTGLKVYGEGEWKVHSHGTGKRRRWKKLHIGIDPETQEILVYELTDRNVGDAATAVKMLDDVYGILEWVLGDGAYDGGNLREKADQLGAKLHCATTSECDLQRC